MSDITSIRELLIRNRARMDLGELTSDTADGLRDWVKEFGDLKEWQRLERNYRG